MAWDDDIKLSPEHTGASSTKLLGWSRRIATSAHLVIMSIGLYQDFFEPMQYISLMIFKPPTCQQKNVQSLTKAASKTREPTGLEDVIPVPSI